MANKTTIDGWTWTSDIGLLWGVGPNGERETVQMPKMTSPWWTIGSDTLADDEDPQTYPEGTVTLIFPTAGKAVRHLLDMHRPALDAEPAIGYEVWKRDLSTGARTRWGGNLPGGTTLRAVQMQVEEFNRDESANARMEMRAPRVEFFIVEATTTYKTYQD